MRLVSIREQYKVHNLFVALPYPHSTIHRGNIAGTFLPADIYRGYLRLRGLKGHIISGLDTYGTGFWLELREKGVLEKYRPYLLDKRRNYLKVLDMYGISPRIFGYTSTRAHRHYVTRQLSSISERLTRVSEAAYYCEYCRIGCSERLLWDGVRAQTHEKIIERGDIPREYRCSICRKDVKERTRPFTRLNYDENLVQRLKRRYRSLDVEETGKIITRYLPWGVPAGSGGEVYYVWPQALLAYGEWALGKKHIYFFGKDNLYYHTLIYRHLVTRKQKLDLCQNVFFCREYLLDNLGKKISASLSNQAEGVARVRSDPMTARLALVLADPFNGDVRYDKRYEDEARKIITNLLLNTFKRIKGLKRYRKIIEYDTEWGIEVKTYHEAMMKNNLKRGLEALLRYRNAIVRIIQHSVKEKVFARSLLRHSHRLKRLSAPLLPKLGGRRGANYSPTRT